MAGEYPLATIGAAAGEAERSGYRSFWLSQPPDRDSLRSLAQVAQQTQAIELGIGAIPLTSRSSQAIADAAMSLDLPRSRLRLGVGSGIAPSALDRVREGVKYLKSRLDVHVVVAPLGPRMCRVAGEVGDSVLLNWLTPEFARTSTDWIREGAESAGRTPPSACAYVRCALAGAEERLAADCARYGGFPHYAAHFRRQSVEPAQTTILAGSATELQERLAAYEAVLDEVIVRAITPNDSIDEALALVEAARPSI